MDRGLLSYRRGPSRARGGRGASPCSSPSLLRPRQFFHAPDSCSRGTGPGGPRRATTFGVCCALRARAFADRPLVRAPRRRRARHGFSGRPSPISGCVGSASKSKMCPCIVRRRALSVRQQSSHPRRRAFRTAASETVAQRAIICLSVAGANPSLLQIGEREQLEHVHRRVAAPVTAGARALRGDRREEHAWLPAL